jgi:hypothetical protein
MDYKAATTLIKQIREITLNFYINKLPMESLIKIPEGYNNNMIWNVGHMISVSYSLNFSIAGLTPPSELEMIKKFRKGSFPEEYTQNDIDWIKRHILYSVEEIERAWEENKIQTIVLPVTTDLGNVVNTPSDALAMTLAHDMLHFERIRLFRKLTR